MYTPTVGLPFGQTKNDDIAFGSKLYLVYGAQISASEPIAAAKTDNREDNLQH